MLPGRFAVAIVSLVLAACSAATPAASPTAPPTPSATPSAAPTPAATPQPTALSGTAGREWEAMPIFLDGSPFLEGLVHIIAGGSGFVTWGPTATGSEVSSTGQDAASWGQAGTFGQFDGETIDAMAAGLTGIVALGRGRSGARHAWRSADGMIWAGIDGATGIDGRVSDMVTYHGGYVAAGPAKDGCGLVVWLSVDGITWHASAPFPGTGGTCPSGPVVFALRVGPTGLIAFGNVRGLGDAFWTSSDGLSWAIHPQASLGGNVGGFVAGGPGYVAVGATGAPARAVVWVSADGATWTRVPDQAAFLDADMADVRSLADGTLIAVGTSFDRATGNRFTAWTSADGLTWQRVPAAVPNDFNVTVRQLATDGQRLVAIGTGTNGVWVSPRVTPGLRPATLRVALSGRVGRPAGPASGTCRNAEDGSDGTFILATVSAADGTLYALNVTVSPGGQIVWFVFYGDPSVMVDASQSGQIDASHFTVATGSTAEKGTVEFRGLTDTSAAGSPALSGSLDWSCGS